MKNEKLLNALGNIDDDLILDAADVTKAKKRKSWVMWGSLAAALVLCVSAGLLGLRTFGPQPLASSIVILDVNPSISLTVDTGEKIVSAEGLNEDGNLILDGMDLSGVDMTVALNAIVGSMLQKGYLSDLQNAILVSVENDDAQLSAALQERVSAILGSTFQGGSLDVTVLSQTLNDTTALEQIAQTYDISLGKAALIQEVIAQDPTMTVQKLAPLSITEIALISQSRDLSPGTVTQDGTASDKAYISREAAVEIAYSHANVNAEDASLDKVEFDSDDGVMIYEVEFYAGTVEHECRIDARTGQVLKYETEDKGANWGHHSSNTQQPATQPPASTQQPASTQSPSGTQQPASTQSPSGAQQPASQYAGEEAAKAAALTHAGVSADAVSYINAWLDYDDGHPEHYKVEFMVGDVEYEYEIDLYTCAVLEHEMKDYGHHADRHGDHSAASVPAADIGAQGAQAAALSHAGLSESQVTGLKADYDYDDGIAKYEVEFKYNGYEYEYEIDAATGTVLKSEIDD